jgi:hypothetical protein
MSSEMIERCARAIYEKRNGPGCSPWANRPKGHKDPYLADARAAIEAMREPTDDMRDAAFDTHFPMSLNQVQEVYRAMIDAALSSPTEDM